MNTKQYANIFKGTYKKFGEDNALRLSAALAYYSMFSIGPLLVIAVGLAGLAFGHETVRHELTQQLQNTLGPKSAKMIESMMAAQKHGTNVLMTIVGMIALLFGATGVFGQLQDALNTIWGVKAKPGRNVWGLIRQRFLSLTMVLGIGFLLLVSMALTTFLTAVTGSLGRSFPLSETLLHALNLVVSFAVITALFAIIFKYLPDVKIPYKKVWVGAVLTSLLFTIGKYLLALYLGRASTSSSYGAAGAVIIVMMWVYYASAILLFGAEFTRVYAVATGTKIVPDNYAVPITQQERMEEGMAPQSGVPMRGPEPLRSPGQIIKKSPWEFAGLMLAAGFAGGVLLRSGSVRKAARIFWDVASRA